MRRDPLASLALHCREQACMRRGICYFIPSASASAQSWLGLMRGCREGAASGASGDKPYYWEAAAAPLVIIDKMWIGVEGQGQTI